MLVSNHDRAPSGKRLLFQGITIKAPQKQSRERLEDNKNQNISSETKISSPECDDSTLPSGSLKESNTFPGFKDSEEKQTAALWLIWLQIFRSLARQNVHAELRFLEPFSPGVLTVTHFLLVLVLFLIIIFIAAILPVKPMRIVVAVIGVLMTIMLGILLVRDYSRGKFFIPMIEFKD